MRTGRHKDAWIDKSMREKREWMKAHWGRTPVRTATYTRSAKAVEAIRNLYLRPGLPGDKTAAAAILRKMGLPLPDEEPVHKPVPTLPMEQVASRYSNEIFYFGTIDRMIALLHHVEQLAVNAGVTEDEIWDQLEALAPRPWSR